MRVRRDIDATAIPIGATQTEPATQNTRITKTVNGITDISLRIHHHTRKRTKRSIKLGTLSWGQALGRLLVMSSSLGSGRRLDLSWEVIVVENTRTSEAKARTQGVSGGVMGAAGERAMMVGTRRPGRIGRALL
jgi:hypothetical protein